ncbi:MAG TPA: DUF4129 domain-containing protein [Kineosporiaceae bacterium]|nr:DUF4129 domain-containing protein [Kineosporiaceae bacterium]
MFVSGLAAVPVHPDRGTAQDWAVQELARREYQEAKPSLAERVLQWVVDQIGKLNFDAGAPPELALLLIAFVVGAVVTYAVYSSGGLHSTARRKGGRVLPERHTTAADHRAAAQRHADAEEWGPAVVERFRAIARELEERALLSPQPGRTAREVARDGGKALPELASDLLVAAHHFDDVSYGHLSTDRRADQALRDLDERLRAARTVPAL